LGHYFALLGRLHFLSFKHGELGRRQGAEAAVRSQVIVVVTPCLDRFARLGEGEEDVLVEAFVAQAAVEALDEGVLHRLAWLDVMPVETTSGPG
jgi:hypothetical protein